MCHVDNIAGCGTLAFVKEFLEEPVLTEQDFDDDDFLPLFLSARSDFTALKTCSRSGIYRNSKLQCFRVLFIIFVIQPTETFK